MELPPPPEDGRVGAKTPPPTSGGRERHWIPLDANVSGLPRNSRKRRPSGPASKEGFTSTCGGSLQVFQRKHPARLPVRFVPLLLGFMLVDAAPAREPAARPGSGLVDLDGKPRAVLSTLISSRSKLAAFIFARTDCPISNAYVPEVRALHAAFAARGLEFWLVFGTNESPELIRKHLTDFRYPCGALRDPHHAFAKQSRVRVTPEAAIYRMKGGELLFQGRIDDRYAALDERRPAPTVRDLHAALVSLLAGKPAKAPAGLAVGCIIEGGE
jgi:hypothetical protein